MNILKNNFTIAFLICAIQSSLYSQTAAQWYKKGDDSYDNNQYEVAVEYYTKAINLGYSPLARAYVYRGSAKNKLGQYEKAIDDYNKAIQLKPDYAEAYMSRANSKDYLGQSKAAIVDYDKAIQLKPDFALAYFNRGVTKKTLTEYQAAITDFDKAIQLDPNYVDSYYNRGLAKSYLSQYQDAIIDCDKAIQLKPDYAEAYYIRSLSKNNLKQYQDAIVDCDRAIQLKSDGAGAYCVRGLAKNNLGQYKDAIVDYDRAIQLIPNLGYLYNHRGFSYYQIGSYTQAIADYDKAISLGVSGNISVYKYREDAVAKLNGSSDNIAPTITITEPSVDSRGLGVGEIENNQTTIRGIANDESGIQNLYINGSSVNVQFDGSFSATTNLIEGSNSFTIKATDKKNNTAEKVFTLRRKQAPKSVEINPVSKTTDTEKRLAMVVGNSEYRTITNLKGKPYNDADDMSATLKQLGFDVITLKDADKQKLEEGIAAFAQRLKQYDVGLFFYAGHGLGVEGKNYLVPIDFPTNATKSDFRYKCIETDWLQEKMAEAGAYDKTNIVIIDACRDDGGLRNIRGGSSDTWTPPGKIPTGLITCYAASQGESAANGNGRNGLYTATLLKYITTAGLKIEDVFKRVRIDLLQLGGQVPEEHQKLTKDFYFKMPTTATPQPSSIVISATPKNVDFTESVAGLSFTMKFIEGKSFSMGSNDGLKFEKPIHTVSLSNFFMSKYEVTNDEFCTFLNEKGNRTEGGLTWLELGSEDNYDIMELNGRFLVKSGQGRHPVAHVSWHAATAYCLWLSEKTSKNYRLPTEAEWEFSARGGQSFKFAGSDNITDVAWCSANSGGTSHEVGTKQSNGFGLYDMSGNVWEWCNDWYETYSSSSQQNPTGAVTAPYRVSRGGSMSDEIACRPTYRRQDAPTRHYYHLGFRVCASVQ